MSAEAFARYARCYDLLYRDKDYAAEAHWVDRFLRVAGARPPGPLLDIGCGTGAHARAMTGLGWKVTGVDLSADMIALAQARTPPAMAIAYSVGRAADFLLGAQFPVVVSLFHVASYQAEVGEFARMAANVARHLRPGGVFVFDFWYGPGVRADPPTVRTRQAEDEEVRVIRRCTPSHRPEENRVDVHYELTLESLAGGETRDMFSETHRLRYYFLSELQADLTTAGLRIESARAGLSDQALDDRSWYGLILARKPTAS